MKEIVIIDYGIGNVKSMANALQALGYVPRLTYDREQVLNAPAVILPGVGAFSKGMENLQKYGLIEILGEFVKSGRPFLGVCLGMQLLLQESDEFGLTAGLGFIPGRVVRMPIPSDCDAKLPHVSWTSLKEPQPGRWRNTILNDTAGTDEVYFVHSFVARPEHPEHVLATADYGPVSFCAAIQLNNISGVQFHPEKSGKVGLRMLDSFLKNT